MSVLDFAKYLRASNRPGAAGAEVPQPAAPEAPVAKTRRRLFTKYVALFVAVVCIALVANGVFDVRLAVRAADVTRQLSMEHEGIVHKLCPRQVLGDAPDFVEVGEAGIAVDHAMRR